MKEKLGRGLSRQESTELSDELSSLQDLLQRQKEDATISDNETAETVRSIAVLQARLGHVVEGESLLTEFCNDDTTSLSSGMNSSLHKLLGSLQFTEGKLDEAANSFERATSFNKDDVRPWESLALTYREAEKHNESAAAYEECIRICPESVSHLTSLALTLVDAFSAANTGQQAVGMLNGSKISSPDDILEGMGLINAEEEHDYVEKLLEKKRKAAEKPLELLHRALKIAPSSIEAKTALAQTLHFAERLEESLNVWTEINEKHPEDVNIINCVGMLCLKLGLLDKAEEAVQKAMKIDDVNPYTHVNACALHCKAGRSKAAINSFKKLLEMAPDEVHAHTSAGMHLASIGHEQTTLKLYTNFVERNPNSEAAKLFRHTFGGKVNSGGEHRYGILAIVILLVLSAIVIFSGVLEEPSKFNSIFASFSAAWRWLIQGPSDEPNYQEL